MQVDKSIIECSSLDFEHILEALPDPSKQDFWKFAARDMQDIRGRRRKSLCQSIYGLDRRDSKQVINGIPLSVRILSDTDLARAVGRLKSRLCGDSFTKECLTWAFCRWVQQTEMILLKEVLTAMDCAHDDDGIHTNGIPEFQEDDAVEALTKLAGKFSANSLAIVCAGLIVNDARWSNLRVAYFSFRFRADAYPDTGLSVSDGTDERLDVLMVDDLSSPQIVSAVEVDRGVLITIKALVQQLQENLREANNALALQRIPKIKSLIGLLETLDHAWGSLSASLGVTTEDITELEAAVERHFAITETTYLFEKCGHIKHVSDSSFDFTAITEAYARLNDPAESSKNALQLVESLRALVQLIEKNQELSEELAGSLYEEVKTGIGKKIATAAMRGNLSIDEKGAPPIPVLSTLQNDHEVPTSTIANSDDTTAEGSQEHIAIEDEIPSIQFLDKLESASNVHVIDDKNIVVSSHSSVVNELNHLELQDSSAPAGTVDEYVTFNDYKKSHWVNQSGIVQSAPWSRVGFLAELEEMSISAWNDGRLATAFIAAKAEQELEKSPSFDITELTVADRLLITPSNAAIGVERNRVTKLRTCISNQKMGPDFGVSVMLEALRPTLPCTFDSDEVAQIVAAANFKDTAIGDVVGFLLNGWASNISPIDVLRLRLNNTETADPATLEKLVKTAQDTLRREINSLWQAAGGKILRKHCQKAWAEFVRAEVVPLREELAPSASSDGTKRLTPTIIEQRINKLIKGYRRIMDGGEVKYDDRAASDNAAEQITAAAIHLQEAVRRLALALQRNRMTFDGCPYEQAVRLISDQSHKGSDDLCVRMFRAVVAIEPTISPLRLGVEYLLAEPNLIRCVNPETFFDYGVVDGQLNPACFDDNVMASVFLRQCPVPIGVELRETSDVFRELHDTAVGLDRLDILAGLSPMSLLQPHERALLYSNALQIGDIVFEQSREIERLWGVQEELLVLSSDILKECVGEARALARPDSSETGQHNSIVSSMLVKEWLSTLIPIARRGCEQAKASRIAIAKERSEELAAEVESCFDAENYRGVTALLHGDDLVDVASISYVRRTEWRQVALTRFTAARHALETNFKRGTEEQQRLVEMWINPKADAGPKESIERLFYSVISGEAGRSVTENQRRFLSLTELRDHNKVRKTIVFCPAIRDYFRRSKLNPSFLPQLAEFSQIVLTSSPAITSRNGGMLDDWARVVGSEDPRALVVFLEPGMSESRRDEICGGFRKRGIAAAVIDDVDICRLLESGKHAEGHDFIPFLELILEQLSLDSVSPFSIQDGQHVRIETYIGRAQEAKQVALGGNYTRVFSGRKLGKSALLKFIAATYDQERLPSGNTLNVFFITIAGGESEAWLVQWIIDEMSARFDLQEVASLIQESPAERFSNYMQRLMQERPQSSILIILDEADAFIEGQLARYDQDRESSLSFRMMKGLPAKVDSQDLHRIRIVFSGYRVTNTRGGVWANAGDVLILRPLTEIEAVQFLRGMLARVGVDLGSHGPSIARRCGFQPAVLIRFGDSLLKRLSRHSLSASRETLRVSEEEVRATLHDQAVLDEIRTVVNNNFQGNRVGAVVFGATLLALRDLEPGLALRSGPAQVLEKLKEIDPNIDWLEKIDMSPIAEIERNLQDFIDRGLLTVSDTRRFGVREYRLRFPHFLTVLTQQSEVALEVRQQIQTIRAGSLHRRLSESIVAESALDTVRYWFSQDTADLCKIVVVAGAWPAALIDEKRGIPDRLGADRRGTAISPSAQQIPNMLDAGFRIFASVLGKSWPQYLSQVHSRPIVLLGGLDLLREARRHVLDSSDTPIEIATLGRLPEATLSWWFERARALQFGVPNAITLIMQKTEGIPFLVAALDRLLAKCDGDDVSSEEMKLAIARFDASLPELVKQLEASNLEFGLSRRERALLQMAVKFAGEVADEFDLEYEFAASWCDIFGEQEGIVAPMTGDDDRLSLEILLDAGLLQRVEPNFDSKVSSLGCVRLPVNSIVVKIVSYFGAIDAS